MYVCYVCMYVMYVCMSLHTFIYITHFISQNHLKYKILHAKAKKRCQKSWKSFKMTKKGGTSLFSKNTKITKIPLCFSSKLPNQKLYKPLPALKFPSVEWGRFYWKRLKVVRRDTIDLQIMYISIYVYMYICICVYVYRCIYSHMYICICVYTGWAKSGIQN